MPAYRTCASAIRPTGDTWIGSPLHEAPSPRTAAYRSPSAGADTTDTFRSPSTWSAISVPQIWMPSAKFFVASIGSRIHVRPPRSAPPCSSPSTASPGKASAIRSRTIASIARSASVTGDRSGFVITSKPLRKKSRPISAARSAVSWAKASSRSNIAGHPTRPQRRRSAGSLAPISATLSTSMQTTVERPEKHTVKLTVEVAPEDFAKDLDRAYRSVANQVKIPGFRKGKVPRRIIDTQIGHDVVMEEFLSSAVPVYFREAVREEDLAPITEPDIDLEQAEDGKPLIFTATVEVRPRLELDGYKGVAIERPDTSVSEQEIDDWVERLRERFAELEPAERAARADDFAVIDIRATLGGEEVEQLTRTDYLHRIGSGEFGPVLDGELPGTKPGDIIEFDQTFDAAPTQLEVPDAGAVHFRVLVKEVKAKRLPPLDDDLAKTASEFDTLDELRTDLREKIHELKERESVGILRDRVLDALVDAHPGRPSGVADRPRDRAPRRRGHRPRRAERAHPASRSWRARAGTRTGSARTPATTRCAPSPATWSWRPSPGPRTSRSRPTRSGPRSTRWPRRTSATRRNSPNNSTEAARS